MIQLSPNGECEIRSECVLHAKKSFLSERRSAEARRRASLSRSASVVSSDTDLKAMRVIFSFPSLSLTFGGSARQRDENLPKSLSLSQTRTCAFSDIGDIPGNKSTNASVFIAFKKADHLASLW